jgi:hypothetical protein
VSKGKRETVADWLMVLGAAALFVSLFLPWSHQFSKAFLARWGTSAALQGVPHDPTAWQVYSAADVLLALLAAGLGAVALRGGRSARVVMVLAVAVAAAFTLHAMSVAPTKGADIFDPSAAVPSPFPNSPTSGIGERIAIAGLGLGVVGLLLSFTAD